MIDSSTTSALSAIFIVLFVYLAIFGIAITDYILSSLALQRIGSRRKVKNPWLVWLPFAHYWAVGALADEYDAHHNIKRKWRVTLLTLSCCGTALYILMFVVMLVQIVSLAVQYGSSALPVGETLSVIFVFYIFFISSLLVLALLGTLYNICCFKIFESVAPKKAVLYFILSLIVPLGRGICLFKSRNSGYYIELRQPEPAPDVQPTEQI